MNDFSADQTSSDGHSPFLAVFVVFVALLVGYALQLWNLAAQAQQIQKTDASLVSLQPQVKILSTTLQGVSRDLMILSTNSPAARQIVSEFGIRVDQRGR